jgi:hypothetical protein
VYRPVRVDHSGQGLEVIIERPVVKETLMAPLERLWIEVDTQARPIWYSYRSLSGTKGPSKITSSDSRLPSVWLGFEIHGRAAATCRYAAVATPGSL